MAYRANVGGLMGSGEYMPSAPQIDVAGAINAASQAFRNNRDDVIRRALMVAQAKREQQAAQLQQAEAAQNGILPTSAAHAYVQSNNDAYDAANPVAPAITSPTGGPSAPPPVMNGMAGAPSAAPRLIAPGASSGSPAPAASLPAGSQSDASGRPMMTAPITGHGARRLSMPIDLGNGYSMIPELTPAARQYEMMDARLRELEAIGAGHDQARVAVAAAHDSTSAANTDKRVAVQQQIHGVPRVTAPHASAGTTGHDPDEKRRSFVLSRIKELTKETKGIGGLPKPGMSLDDATHQANVEWAAANGEVPPPRSVVPPAPSDGESGAGAQADYDTAAAKYKHALELGIDPTLARDAYNTDVMAIAKKHGHR